MRGVLLALCGAAALGLLGAAPSDAPTASPSLSPAPGQRVTKCANCHGVGGWRTVTFPHERTGFPLQGAHASTACKSCHAVDFVQQVPQTCAGCHRDIHAGSLGMRCEGCHDEKTWHSAFGAEAHRRTNFPLTGRHALLPCESCHPDARQKTFSRGTVDCVACHTGDFARAASLGIDHVRLGICTDCQSCRQCHDVSRFTGARFAAHEACFQINGGVHGGIQCESCHQPVVPTQANMLCNTGTANCTNCHAHQKTQTDGEHPNVPGYVYSSPRCYFCHQFR